MHRLKLAWAITVLSSGIGVVLVAGGPNFQKCPKATPCYDLRNKLCLAGDASRNNGAGLVFCDPSKVFCDDESACYGLGSGCVCTGDKPCRPLNGACEAYSGSCSATNQFLQWCPSAGAPATPPPPPPPPPITPQPQVITPPPPPPPPPSPSTSQPTTAPPTSRPTPPPTTARPTTWTPSTPEPTATDNGSSSSGGLTSSPWTTTKGDSNGTSSTTTARPLSTANQTTNNSNSNGNVNPATTTTTAKSDSNTLLIVVTVTVGVVVIAIIIAIVYCQRRRRYEVPVPVAVPYVAPAPTPAPTLPPRKSSATVVKPSKFLSTGGSTAAWNRSSKQLDMGNLEMFRIPPEDIGILKVIAAGAYGQVSKADYHGQTVAVKSLLVARKSDMTQLVNFIDEIKLHSQIDCEFIVQFIGASWTKPSDIVMVTEYMDNGDLRNFLQATTPATLAWRDKLDIALSVSQALVYLHSLDPKVIHRDLKSRNVLLNGDLQAKVTDFGISREFDDIETMTAGLSTHLVPYEDLKNARGNPYIDTALMAKLMNGEIIPSFAVKCPQWYLKLAKRCMALDPQLRPTAMEVVHSIRTELRKLR
ncbi:unnamed protein product [Aphanomyces euteiches]